MPRRTITSAGAPEGFPQASARPPAETDAASELAPRARANGLEDATAYAERRTPSGPATDSSATMPGPPVPQALVVGPADDRAVPTFASWSKRYTARLVLLDGLVASFAVLASFTSFSVVPAFDLWKMVVLALGAAVAWPVAVGINHGYERSRIGVGGDEMRAVLSAVVLGIAAGAVPSAITGNYGVVTVCTLATPLAGLASLAVRFLARKHLHRRQRRGMNLRRVVVVGGAHAAAELVTVLARESHAGMQIIGACVPRHDVDRARALGLAVVGDLEQVSEVVSSYGADAVAVTGGETTQHNYLRELSWSLEGVDVELLVHPGLVEVAGPRMHIQPHVGLPLLQVEQPHFAGWRRFVKRATDLTLTSLGLVVITPALALVALAVKLSDGGPVLFRQTRVGLDGSTFTMYKFRSMHLDAETKLTELKAVHPHIGPMFKLEDDPRITAVGRVLRRFSLDELPQLFNVLTGSMSLVGPRPPLPVEVDAYETHARRRLLVTPGLTGLWQVSGRSLLSWEETVRLDLRYVENWTLTLDLLIIWKTFFAVLARRGAY